jgi:quercetin dioxygenase-like cupin family protein
MDVSRDDTSSVARVKAMSDSRRHLTGLSAVAAVVMAVSACGGAASSGPDVAAAHLMRVDELAAGKLDALPTGSQFARLELFHQTPGQSFPSRKHQPGIVYVQTGKQRLAYSDGQSVDILTGTAVYQTSVAHSHTNTGTTDNAWYFIGLWASEQRAVPLAGTVVFETEDIPSSTLRPGSYIETVRRVTLQPGGRSPAHRFGGLEVVFVLDGNLTVHVAGHGSTRLSAGQGTYVDPDTVTQELAGSSTVYLAYFVTPQGHAFETDVTSAPPG